MPLRLTLGLVALSTICLLATGLAEAAPEQTGIRCRATVTAPRFIPATPVLRSTVHVTCREIPSLAPSWQRWIKVVVCLQRFGSPYDPVPDLKGGQCKTFQSFNDYMVGGWVQHRCMYTTVDYYWVATAYALNRTRKGTSGKSRVIRSRMGVGKCF